MKTGWKQTPLEDCLEKLTIAAKIQRKSYSEVGTYPIVSQEAELISGYWDKASDVSHIDRPVVIFGDHTQVVKFIDFDFVVGADGVKVLNPKEFIDPKYFYYYILANPVPSLGYARHYRHLRELQVKYPPLDEQKRIVAILDEAFEGLERARANAEANLKDARQLFESALNESLLNQVGVASGRLGDHVDLLSGFAFKSKNYVSAEDGIRLVRGDNITPTGIRWDDVKYWSKADGDPYRKYQLEAGDVLIAMDRTWIRSGIKYAILSENDAPSLLVQRVARLRCQPSLLKEYLAALIGSRAFEKYVLSVQTGIGVPHISARQIEDFSVPVPKIALQQEIVERLSDVEVASSKLMAIYSSSVNDFGDLRRSLLQRAFSGELT